MSIENKIEEIKEYLASSRGPAPKTDAIVSELVVSLETAVKALICHNELYALSRIHFFLRPSIDRMGAIDE